MNKSTIKNAPNPTSSGSGEGKHDLIDRQAAIDIVHRYNKSHMILKGKPMIGWASIVIELEDLPSAQPRKGKWTRHFDGNEWYWYCSSCKEQWYEEELWMGGNSFPNFCPNCGSYNGGEQTG